MQRLPPLVEAQECPLHVQANRLDELEKQQLERKSVRSATLEHATSLCVNDRQACSTMTCYTVQEVGSLVPHMMSLSAMLGQTNNLQKRLTEISLGLASRVFWLGHGNPRCRCMHVSHLNNSCQHISIADSQYLVHAQVDLMPRDQADDVMIKAANKALVGIAIFSPDDFQRKWPMEELKILVKRGVLLPVRIRFDKHEDFVQALRSSPHAHPSRQEREGFAQSVERTTYVPSEHKYTSRLQQVGLQTTMRLFGITCHGPCPVKMPSTSVSTTRLDVQLPSFGAESI